MATRSEQVKIIRITPREQRLMYDALMHRAMRIRKAADKEAKVIFEHAKAKIKAEAQEYSRIAQELYKVTDDAEPKKESC